MFQWTNAYLSSHSGRTFCWRIDDTYIVRQGEKIVSEVAKVSMCYTADDLVYQYNKKIWFCSESSNNTIPLLQSKEYILSDDGISEVSTSCVNSNTSSLINFNDFAYACERDGHWKSTLVGENATRTGACYNGTVNGW